MNELYSQLIVLVLLPIFSSSLLLGAYDPGSFLFSIITKRIKNTLGSSKYTDSCGSFN